MKTILIYIAAAFFEIAGSFAFWAWFRLDKSPLWSFLGVIFLIIFAILLTKSQAVFAGRAFAAYGGIYIVSSIAWLALVEKTQPDRWDILGAAIILAGTAIILFGPRNFPSV